jgi:AraC-like DNA-binding protein
VSARRAQPKPSGAPFHAAKTAWVLVSVAEERGLDTTRLLRDAAIPREVLSDPHGRISVSKQNALARALLQHSGDPTIGLDVGRHYDPAAFDLLGAVAMLLPTAREAMGLFVDNAHLLHTFFTVAFLESAGEARLSFTDGDVELDDLRRFYVDRDLSLVVSMCRTIWPATAAQFLRSVEIDYAEPLEAARYHDFFRCLVRFGAAVATVVVDPLADQPRTPVNPLGLALAKERLRAFAGERGDGDLVASVCRHIAIGVGIHRSLPEAHEIARALGMSDRALREQLARRGTRFRALADQVVARYAKRYLREGTQPVAAVAEQLGYGEAASFVRAFRRWTGTTPEQYRRRGGPRARRSR